MIYFDSVNKPAGVIIRNNRFVDSEIEELDAMTTEELNALFESGTPARIARRMPLRIRIRKWLRDKS
jgi:hypothetical protein